MREEIRAELEQEYAQRRAENERIEESRKREIAEKYPEIYALVREREQLVFGTLRQILNHQTREENLPEKMRSLSEQIRRKLKEAGLPENYLEPVYRCPLCRDTGYTGEPVREMCACMKEARQRKMQTQYMRL
jgi:DNA replication protein DnaC